MVFNQEEKTAVGALCYWPLRRRPPLPTVPGGSGWLVELLGKQVDFRLAAGYGWLDLFSLIVVVERLTQQVCDVTGCLSMVLRCSA